MKFQNVKLSLLLTIIPSFLLSTSLAKGAINYEGSFTSQATSYEGESYKKSFQVSVSYHPKSLIQGKAEVAEKQYCVYSDEPSLDCRVPEDFEQYCVTSLTLDLGKVNFEIIDLETNERVQSQDSWVATISSFSKKLENQPCTPASLAGATVKGQTRGNGYFLNSTAGTQRKVELVLDGDFNDLGMVSKLIPAGKNTYQVEAFAPKSQTSVFWTYYHKLADNLTWGNSGQMTLNKK
ncbi:MAG: hypothetical protein ACXWRE_04265 [Pseudobdellovibrionaceae bacterium]